MKNEDLYNGITQIRDETIERAESYQFKKKKTKPMIKWIAVAACLCLLVGSITVFASETGIRIIDLFTGRTESGSDFRESGYDISVSIEKVPLEYFSQDVRNVKDIIVKQIENYMLYDSKSPNCWNKEFQTSGEARSFIGLTSLRALEWDINEQMTSLTIIGDNEGEPKYLNLETSYIVGNIRMQSYSYIYTEKYSDEIIFGGRTTEDIGFTGSNFTTDNGILCHTIASSAMESGYLCLDSFIIEEGVLYELHLAYLSEDASQAENLLHQWANLF